VAVAEVGKELGAHVSFNFLLGDGRDLFARCGTRLCYILRKAPFGAAKLVDDDLQIDFSAVTSPRDRVAILATRPLTTFDGGRLRGTL
jgi:predicted glutamine amidotransferase